MPEINEEAVIRAACSDLLKARDAVDRTRLDSLGFKPLFDNGDLAALVRKVQHDEHGWEVTLSLALLGGETYQLNTDPRVSPYTDPHPAEAQTDTVQIPPHSGQY